MYKSSLPRSREVAIHLIFWVIWFYYMVVVISENGPEIVKPSLFITTGIIIYFITFYVNYLFVLPKVFKPFKWAKAIVAYIVVSIFFSGLRYLVEEIITLKLLNQNNYFHDTSITFYLYDNIFYASKPILFSTVLWVVILLIRTLDYNNFIIQEQKNTEIKFLKSQINPHFVFNTLNNIYSMVHFQSPHALSSIEKLGDIMRFTTYEAPRERIRLSEEIKYMKAYIELEELRHYEKAFVRMDIDVTDEHMEIPPYILSPLIENALKHGRFSQKTPIEVFLFCDEKRLVFEVKNVIGTQKKDKLGGIGLDNLTNRLEILYPQKHTLDIVRTETIFSANLKIDWQ